MYIYRISTQTKLLEPLKGSDSNINDMTSYTLVQFLDYLESNNNKTLPYVVSPMFIVNELAMRIYRVEASYTFWSVSSMPAGMYSSRSSYMLLKKHFMENKLPFFMTDFDEIQLETFGWKKCKEDMLYISAFF
jgi:hypothetical protein